jgi:biotin operon repressor
MSAEDSRFGNAVATRLPRDAWIVWRQLSEAYVSINMIAQRLGLTADEVLSALDEIERHGVGIDMSGRDGGAVRLR